jgi:hypothetical protein
MRIGIEDFNKVPGLVCDRRHTISFRAIRGQTPIDGRGGDLQRQRRRLIVDIQFPEPAQAGHQIRQGDHQRRPSALRRPQKRQRPAPAGP